MSKKLLTIKPNYLYSDILSTRRGFATQIEVFNAVFSAYYEHKDNYDFIDPLPLDQTVSLSKMLLSIMCKISAYDFDDGEELSIDVSNEAYMLFPSSPYDLKSQLSGLNDVFSVYTLITMEEGVSNLLENVENALKLKNLLSYLLIETFLEYDWIQLKNNRVVESI